MKKKNKQFLTIWGSASLVCAIAFFIPLGERKSNMDELFYVATCLFPLFVACCIEYIEKRGYINGNKE